MKTAVIYARFSCSKQREASIDDQIRACQEWAKANDYIIINTYTDSAQSGRTDERAAFQTMVSNAGESEAVLVYAWDRFSRDKYDFTIYKKKFKDKGCKVISITEPIAEGIEAVLLESMFEALAVIESERTAQRVKRGMTGNALKCLYNGNVIFGYDVDENGRYIVNDGESAIVNEVFDRKIAGESINSIAADLARRGIGSRGNPATYGFVYNMLRNERYTGVYIWGEVRKVGGMPMIIEPERFQLAQTSKSRRTNKREYPLSRKLLCPSCFSDMSGMGCKGRSKIYYYYRCKKCPDVKPIRADLLENEISNAIRDFLSDRKTALSIARTVEEVISGQGTELKVKGYQSQKKECERQIESLVDAVANGFDAKKAQSRIDLLESKLTELNRLIVTAQTATKFDVEEFADFLQFGATLTDSKLLEVFVYQVLINDNEIIVTLDYDIEKGKPARLTVCPKSKWWTISNASQISITIYQGFILIKFPRVA